LPQNSFPMLDHIRDSFTHPVSHNSGNNEAFTKNATALLASAESDLQRIEQKLSMLRHRVSQTKPLTTGDDNDNSPTTPTTVHTNFQQAQGEAQLFCNPSSFNILNNFFFLFCSSVFSHVHTFYYPWYGAPEEDGVWLHWNHEYIPHWERSIDLKFQQYKGQAHKPPADVAGVWCTCSMHQMRFNF
jgi:hypothetical protein